MVRPISSDHIITPLLGAVRFGSLDPTPFLDGRCTFLDLSRLGSGLSLRMFPEFTQFVLTAYAERTPSLNVRDIFFFTNLIIGSICCHLGFTLNETLELSAIVIIGYSQFYVTIASIIKTDSSN